MRSLQSLLPVQLSRNVGRAFGSAARAGGLTSLIVSSMEVTMLVICEDASVTGGKLAKGAVYEVCEIISDQDGDYFRLVETGRSCWFVDRFRPFNDNSQFLSGADAKTEVLDNRRKQEVHT